MPESDTRPTMSLQSALEMLAMTPLRLLSVEHFYALCHSDHACRIWRGPALGPMPILGLTDAPNNSTVRSMIHRINDGAGGGHVRAFCGTPKCIRAEHLIDAAYTRRTCRWCRILSNATLWTESFTRENGRWLVCPRCCKSQHETQAKVSRGIRREVGPKPKTRGGRPRSPVCPYCKRPR